MKKIIFTGITFFLFSCSIYRVDEKGLLNLSNRNLKSIKLNDKNYLKVKSLNLSYNKFTSFPNEIFQMKNLEHLSLSNTNISSIPEEIIELQKIKTLNLRRAPIGYLPKNISKLKNLTKLLLIDCPIQQDKDSLQEVLKNVKIYWE